MTQLPTLMERRAFSDPKLVAFLDEMTMTELVIALGEHDAELVRYHEAGWSPGDGRPSFADDDPAVMAAIGRCAVNRNRWGMTVPDWAHPAPCGWCDVPLDELVRACAWSVWASQTLVSHTLIWRQDREKPPTQTATYERQGDALGPKAPAYRDFAASSEYQQRERVAAAVQASR